MNQDVRDDLVANMQALQAEVTALREEVRMLRGEAASQPAPTEPTAVAATTGTPSSVSNAESAYGNGGGTSRRGLLRGAAVGAAAAAVAAVAIGGAEPAHAAPAATGSPLILGQSNNADAPTTLTISTNTSPSPLLAVNSTLGVSIQAYSGLYGIQSGAYGANAVAGVYGESDVAVGVYGNAGNGDGVHGYSESGVGGVFAGDRAQISLTPGVYSGAPAYGAHVAGDIYLDKAAVAWVCVTSGTPGTWVRLPAVSSAATGGAITYLTHPIRLLDTRADTTATSAHQIPQAKLTPGAAYTVNVANVTFDSVSVPAGAVGALGNLTVVQPGSAGFLAAVPSGAGFQGTSNVNYLANQIVPNFFTVNLAGGNLDVYVDPNSQPVDVLLDLFAVVL
jgi:hypothetical protein